MFKIKEIASWHGQLLEEMFDLDTTIQPENMALFDYWRKIGESFYDAVGEYYDYDTHLEKVPDTSLVGFYINVFVDDTVRDSFASCELIPWFFWV